MTGKVEATFTDAAGALRALEQLTVDRKYNRGTLEVFKTKGGEAIALNCSHHHLMSLSINGMNQDKVKDLVEFLKETADEILDEIGNGLKREDAQAGGDIDRKVADLKDSFRRLIEIKKDAAGEATIGNLKPLSRNEIKTIVMGLKGLQEQSVEKFNSFNTATLVEFASEYERKRREEAILKPAKDLVHQFAKKNANSKLQRNDHILTKLEDRKYVKACGEKDFGLVNLGKIEPPQTGNSIYTFEDVFSYQIGSVSKIGQDLAKKGLKFCTLVRGDTTYNGGMLIGGSYLKDSTGQLSRHTGFNSQEEAVIRNLDPASTAHLFAKGYLAMRKTAFGVQFEYVKNPDNTRKLAPPDGIMMKGTFESVDNVTDDVEPFETNLLYGAMVPLNIKETSVDIGGCVYYASKGVKLLSSGDVTAEERANAEKFYSDLLPKLRKTFKVGKNSVDVELGKKIMKVALFQSEAFNVFGNDTERAAGIQRLISLFKNDPTGGELYNQANANYEKVVADRIDTWVRHAVARGDDVFLGSDIGCGEFGNDSAVIGRFFGAAFAKYGAKMKFVYQQGSHAIYQNRREEFEAGFKAGFNAERAKQQMVLEVQIPEANDLGAADGYDGRNTEKLVRALNGMRDPKKVFTYTINYVSRALGTLKPRDDDSVEEKEKRSARREAYLKFLEGAKKVIEGKDKDTIDIVSKKKALYLLIVAEAGSNLPEELYPDVFSALNAAKDHLENQGN